MPDFSLKYKSSLLRCPEFSVCIFMLPVKIYLQSAIRAETWCGNSLKALDCICLCLRVILQGNLD